MEKPLSTAEVYDAWDEIETHSDVSSAPMTLALGAGDVPEIASLMHNDLEPAAFVLRPELEDKKAAFLEAGALGAVMSGSGPTIFGVARDEEHARSLAAAVRDHFDRVVPLTSRGECIERLD
jgi:4-diphosphocytidyl-2-C-methyl-D-erythritol kinase